jgi:HEAT repeat protein/predicted Ser/Thr protein kinase
MSGPVSKPGSSVSVNAGVRPREDLVGTVIGDRYDVLERLTSGGMGVVYRVRHILLDNEMAIKVLLKPQDPDAQYRFLQEAQLASKIKHPNTVIITDFGLLDDGRSYIAMEFLRGPTLQKLISEGAIAPVRALFIAVQIARGLQAVHDKGIIHRDLKPDNIFLVEQDGQKDFVKIVDFGIATSAGGLQIDGKQAPLTEESLPAGAQQALEKRHTMPGMVLGTPQYMSPEQTQGMEIDARVDQYALGCILYEMLTGTVPFDDPKVLTVMFKQAAAPVPPIRERLPSLDIPDSLEQVLLRMLAKKPADRFGSMRELEEALLGELDNLQGAASVAGRLTGAQLTRLGTGPIRQLGPKVRPLGARRGVLFAVAAGSLLLGLLIFAGGSKLLQRFGRSRSDEAATRRLLAARERALAVLKQDLQTQTPELRASALATLAETHDAALVPTFTALLDDSEPRVQVKAAEALGQLGRREAAPRLLSLLDGSRPPPLTVAAATALDQLGDARGRQALTRAMTGKSDSARLRAALYLSGTGDRDAKKLLNSSIDKGLVADAAQLEILPALAQSGDARARERLVARLAGGGTPESRLVVASALWRLGEPRGRAYLQEQAKRPGPGQLKATQALAALDEPVDAEVFRAVLRQSQAHPAAKLLAVTGLGYSGQRDDLQLMEPLLEQRDDASLRQGAAAAVVRLTGADPAVLAMQDVGWATGALQGESALRDDAVAVLGTVGSADAMAALGRLLRNSPDAKVRREAARALADAKDRASLLALKEGLRDSDAEVRKEVIAALGSVGRRLSARGAKSVSAEAAAWLAGIATASQGAEALLARAAMLRLGDDKQRDAIASGLKESDPATRRQLIEQLDRNADLLATALRDPDPSLRLLAARKLTDLGDKRAIPTLREAVGSEPESQLGLQAYALLRKLNEKVEPPASAPNLLDSEQPETRAAALQAVVAQDPTAAVPALQKATHDPDRGVRLEVAALAAKLLPAGAGRPLLRTLVKDGDPTVRARAGKLLRGLDEPSETAEDEPEPAADKAAAKEPKDGKGEPASSGDKPLAADPTSSGEATNTTSKPDASDESATTGLVEKLLRSGVDAFNHGDYGKAQKSLEKATALCAREKAQVCAPVAYDLSYYLGRTLDAQGQYADAMNEFEKLRKARGGKSASKAYVAEAVTRLSKKLGRVSVTKPGRRGKCVTTDLWMVPGRHEIRINASRTDSVEIRAQQHKEVKACP